MTRRTLEKNINRLDEFMGYPHHSIDNAAEIIKCENFLYFIDYYVLFYFLGHGFTVLLPLDEYIELLQWAKSSPNVHGVYDMAGPSGSVQTNAGILNFENQFTIFEFLFQTDPNGGRGSLGFSHHGRSELTFKINQ